VQCANRKVDGRRVIIALSLHTLELAGLWSMNESRPTTVKHRAIQFFCFAFFHFFSFIKTLRQEEAPRSDFYCFSFQSLSVFYVKFENTKVILRNELSGEEFRLMRLMVVFKTICPKNQARSREKRNK
jgi:hypothetical protein